MAAKYNEEDPTFQELILDRLAGQPEPGLEELTAEELAELEALGYPDPELYELEPNLYELLLEDLEAAKEEAKAGRFEEAQRQLELKDIPSMFRSESRDALSILHRVDKGEKSPEERATVLSAFEYIFSEDTKTLTSVDRGGGDYTNPMIGSREAVASALHQRHNNYFESQGEETNESSASVTRTPNEVVTTAYETLLTYVEDHLKDSSLPIETAEKLRTVRDIFHGEISSLALEFQQQTNLIEETLEVVPDNDTNFNPALFHKIMRTHVGAELDRATEVIEIIRDSSDPGERKNLIDDLQNKRIPLRESAQFEGWKQDRQDGRKAVEAQGQLTLGQDARGEIEDIFTKAA